MDADSLRERIKKMMPEKRDAHAVDKPGVFQMSGPPGWDPQLTDEQREFLRGYFQQEKGVPIVSMVLICKKHDCHYRRGCPLYQMDPDLVPEGSSCPVELTHLAEMLSDFREELDIGDEDIVDLSMLKELIMWTLYAKRAQMEMAEDPKILRQDFMGIDKDGNAVTKEQMHPIFTLLEKASRVKQKLLDALLATREAKSRDRHAGQGSLGQVMELMQVELQKKKQELQQEAETKGLQLPEDYEEEESPEDKEG